MFLKFYRLLYHCTNEKCDKTFADLIIIHQTYQLISKKLHIIALIHSSCIFIQVIFTIPFLFSNTTSRTKRLWENVAYWWITIDLKYDIWIICIRYWLYCCVTLIPTWMVYSKIRFIHLETKRNWVKFWHFAINICLYNHIFQHIDQ